jgi:hypothetical protein
VISVAHYLWERVPKLRARILKTAPPGLVDLDRSLTGTILVLGVSPLGQSEEEGCWMLIVFTESDIALHHHGRSLVAEAPVAKYRANLIDP